MFDLDKWEEIYLAIKKNKLRTALTAFGMFWGIFLLIVMLGASSGLENGASSQFDVARNALFVWTRRTSIPYQGYQPGRSVELVNEDRELILSHVPGVQVVTPRLRVDNASLATYKNKQATFSTYGDRPDILKVKPMPIRSGRFLNEEDLEDRRKVIAIGERVRDLLFEPGEEPLGKYIQLGEVYFQVVGVFGTNSTNDDAIDDVQSIYMPISTMQATYNIADRIGWFAMLPKDGVPAAQVEEQVKQLLGRKYHVSPEDRRAFGSANVEEQFADIQNILIGIRGFSWLVAIGTIISGIVGVANIMAITVKERTREFGIRKSLGATPISIISMITQEAVVLSAVSGYIGLLLGVLFIEGINGLMSQLGARNPYFANPEVDFETAIWAIGLLLVSGIIAGLIPGIRAASIDPVLALRDE
ncbi:MAG: ABC transporter permease [Bacteroidota bacterium]